MWSVVVSGWFVFSVVHVGPKFWLILLFLFLCTIFFSKPLSMIIASGNNDHSLSSNYLLSAIYSALYAPIDPHHPPWHCFPQFWIDVRCGEYKELVKVTHSEVTEPWLVALVDICLDPRLSVVCFFKKVTLMFFMMEFNISISRWFLRTMYCCTLF